MSSEAGWIAVVGWDEMTHSDATRGGGPLPWRRDYARTVDDDGYYDLPAAPRAIFHGLVYLALKSGGRVVLDTTKLSRRLGLRVTKRHLESLNHAGLIGFCASTAQASRLHAASPRARREELEREINPKDVREEAEVERPQDFSHETNGAEPSEMPELEQPASELVESDNDPVTSLTDRLSKGIPF